MFLHYYSFCKCTISSFLQSRFTYRNTLSVMTLQLHNISSLFRRSTVNAYICGRYNLPSRCQRCVINQLYIWWLHVGNMFNSRVTACSMSWQPCSSNRYQTRFNFRNICGSHFVFFLLWADYNKYFIIKYGYDVFLSHTRDTIVPNYNLIILARRSKVFSSLYIDLINFLCILKLCFYWLILSTNHLIK